MKYLHRMHNSVSFEHSDCKHGNHHSDFKAGDSLSKHGLKSDVMHYGLYMNFRSLIENISQVSSIIIINRTIGFSWIYIDTALLQRRSAINRIVVSRNFPSLHIWDACYTSSTVYRYINDNFLKSWCTQHSWRWWAVLPVAWTSVLILAKKTASFFLCFDFGERPLSTAVIYITS